MGTFSVDMHAKRRVWSMHKDQLCHHDVCSWTTLILGYVQVLREGILALGMYAVTSQEFMPDDQNLPVQCLQKAGVIHPQLLEGSSEFVYLRDSLDSLVWLCMQIVGACRMQV